MVGARREEEVDKVDFGELAETIAIKVPFVHKIEKGLETSDTALLGGAGRSC